MGDILFLAHRVPYPPDRGDKIRGFHLLRHLSARQRVHLVAFADDPKDFDRAGQFDGDRSIVWRGKSQLAAAAQAVMSRRPVSIAAFDDNALRAAVENMLDDHDIDTIFVFSSQMAQYLPAAPRQRVIMDFVDMDSAKFAEYSIRAKGPMRWIMAREARLLKEYETAVAGRVDASLFVSEAEAALFRARTGASRVHVVENGIDTDVFDPAAGFERVEAAGPLIVFTGQMDYRPNIEAVAWFAETILPQIRRTHVDAQFAIVGRNPASVVTALAKQPGVTVVGEVADVRGWLAAAAVVVAPLKLARGIQNKVLEGMAMARPVVASAAAAEGIDHDGTILVGTTGDAIAGAVTQLLSDWNMADDMGKAARRRVIGRYGWEARLASLDTLLGLAPRQVDVRKSAA